MSTYQENTKTSMRREEKERLEKMVVSIATMSDSPDKIIQHAEKIIKAIDEKFKNGG